MEGERVGVFRMSIQTLFCKRVNKGGGDQIFPKNCTRGLWITQLSFSQMKFQIQQHQSAYI